MTEKTLVSLVLRDNVWRWAIFFVQGIETYK
jgi:hypothetical protein